MNYRVVFSPEATEQLAALYSYITAAASPDIAARYTEAIVSYCESLCAFAHRGTMRDDVRSGLRITNYKKRAVIAFDVDAEQVSVIGVFYGARTTKRSCKTTPRTARSTEPLTVRFFPEHYPRFVRSSAFA